MKTKAAFAPLSPFCGLNKSFSGVAADALQLCGRRSAAAVSNTYIAFVNTADPHWRHMKTHRQLKTLGLVALTGAMIGTGAHAQDAGDTKVQIDALKAQIGQLMQQVNELGARQADTARRQQAIEVAAPAVVAPATATAGRGISARFGGVDVRLFGSFDAYFENQETGAGTVNRVAASGNGYAQLGFDAVKDLGDGTKVFGDVRLSYQPDNGKTNSTVRTFNTSMVGFTNERFGTLQVGRQGTQMGEALSTFRLIRLGTGNFIYAPFSTLTHDNMVKYISPEFNHFRASANVDFGEVAGTQNKGRGAAAMLKYDDGRTTAVGGIFQSRAPLDISTDGDRLNVMTVGVAHNLGFMKPFVVIQNAKSGKTPHSADQQGLYYGIDFPVGPGTLRVEGEQVKNKAWQKADAQSVNVRYDWLLAPNTTVYFTATKIRDQANVYYPIVGTGGFAAVAQANSNPLNPTFNSSLNGKDPSSVAVGVKFDF
jgi:predicted porin